MEAASLSPGKSALDESHESGSQQTRIAYLVIVRKGPSWLRADLEPLCRLLSERFAGEIWAFGSYEADVQVDRFRLRVVNEQRFTSHPLNVLFSLRRMLRWAQDLRERRIPDLAIVSLEPFNGGLLGLYVAHRTGGAFLCEVNGVYADSNNVAAGRLRGRFLSAIRRRVGAFVLARSTAVRLLFAGQLRGFARLPAGVLTRQFFDIAHIERFYAGEEQKIILGAGFPFRVKGFDVLCRAFHAIAVKHPEWKLVLIGYRAPEDLRAANLEHPQIEVHSGMLQAELAKWMSRCAIFVLPSRTEAMGRVLIEAGAAGKCRVASRVDGIPTVIDDGVDGLLVDKEDVGALAAVISRLIEDAALRQQFGDAARARVERDFSGRAYLDHYAEFVSSALAERRQ